MLIFIPSWFLQPAQPVAVTSTAVKRRPGRPKRALATPPMPHGCLIPEDDELLKEAISKVADAADVEFVSAVLRVAASTYTGRSVETLVVIAGGC